MIKKHICVVLITAGLFFVFGCSSSSGSADPENTGNNGVNTTTGGASGGSGSITFAGNGNVTITQQSGSDITITKTESGENVTLTAETGYSDYKWYKDGVLVSGVTTNVYTFNPFPGITMVYLTARKDSILYSSTIYISK